MTTDSHGRSGRPWRRIREQVLRRDPNCMIRGPKCTGVSTTVDHVVPLSKAPHLAHDLNNLRGACGPCNYGGGARITNNARRAAEAGLRLTYRGQPCPVANHGTICAGGHLVHPRDWRPEYAGPATWPDGEFAPGRGRLA